MPFHIHVEDQILRLTLTGTLTNADLAGAGEAARDIEARRPVVPHRITDMRPVTRLEIDLGGVATLALNRLGLRFPNSFKSAIIAPDRAHYGFARMFQVLNDHPQITIALFPNDKDALAWLASPGRERPDPEWDPSPEA